MSIKPPNASKLLVYLKKNKGINMNENEKTSSLFYKMPKSFTYELSRNVTAMRTFCQLPDDARQNIVIRAQNITSKKEMHSFVANISKIR